MEPPGSLPVNSGVSEQRKDAVIKLLIEERAVAEEHQRVKELNIKLIADVLNQVLLQYHTLANDFATLKRDVVNGRIGVREVVASQSKELLFTRSQLISYHIP